MISDKTDVDLLIVADTICVDKGGKILEKPKDKEEHMKFLRVFSGSSCKIITCMVLTYIK